MLEQIKAKALPIVEALYPGYELLFIFDNATNHVIYAKNILQAMHINKGPRNQQFFLQIEWYKAANKKIITQKLCLLTKNLTIDKLIKIQKRI